MSEQINSFFQFLGGRLGLQPANVAAITLVIVLALVLLSLFLLIKLRGARRVIGELGERLGYEPPHGDGEEILHEEYRREIVQRGKDVKIDQLEQRVQDLEAERETKQADFAALQQRSKELEGQLEQASLQIGKVAANTEQSNSYRQAAEQLEQRMHEMEAESSTSLAALQHRTKELEDQLQQAALQKDGISAQAVEQAEAGRAAVEHLEQRIRQMQAEGSAYLSALELRSRELEEQLLQANLQKDKVAAQAGDQLQAYRATVEQLEQRLRQMEAEGGAYLSVLELQSKELEQQLRQANLRNDEIVAQANEQEQAHLRILENFEQRIRDKASEGSASQAGLQRRVEELEEKLQVAALRHENVTVQSGEQLQSYRGTVDQLERRVREVQAEGTVNLAVLARRSKELEEQLQQATIQNDAIKVQAGEQTQAHRSIVEKLEESIRQLEAEGGASLAAAQQRAIELEHQLRHVAIEKEEVKAQADEQAQALRSIVEQLEERIRQLEAEGGVSLAAAHQRAADLEHQLRLAAIEKEEVKAQADEQAQALRSIVEQLEERVRQLEAEGGANLAVLQHRTFELEEQLRQAAIEKEEVKGQVGEQAQAHRGTVEQLEERIRQLEAEGGANLAAAHQRAMELEKRLQQEAIQRENERSILHQEVVEKNAGMERLELLVRELRAENDAKESTLNPLRAHVEELEDQLRQAVGQIIPEKAEVANTEIGSGDAVFGTDKQLLHRAEWITSHAVGAILPHGLVAAEAYASAALAANPQSKDAPQLLAELARIRRAFPGGLPSVTDSITTFDERVAAFLAADLVRAADIAEEEAQRRYRASLNRSALLATNLAIELRQKSTGENSPETVRLQELKSSLLARLGSNGAHLTEGPKLASS